MVAVKMGYVVAEPMAEGERYYQKSEYSFKASKDGDKAAKIDHFTYALECAKIFNRREAAERKAGETSGRVIKTVGLLKDKRVVMLEEENDGN